MRKFLLLSLFSAVVASSSALGDTIHLKNGSVLKGKVASFADDQFIVMLDTGSGRYLSRAMVYMGDVARIEFDSTPASGVESAGAANKPTEPAPRVEINEPRSNPPKEQPKNNQPVETQPREISPPETHTAAPPPKEPESTQPEKPSVTTPPPTTPPGSETSDSERPIRKQSPAIKTMTVDVAAKKDWTSSGLIVKRGDHLRVTATGTITLDPVSGRTCGPEGISDLPDPKKLMPDQPTGALIAVISSDNDDFIFLGRSGEFTAMRDGLLFLSVNEGVLSDNTGTFKAVVEVIAQRKQER